MQKVKTHHHGFIVYQATCEECDFGACIFTKQTPSEQKVQYAAKKHVKNTGHTVTIEAAKSWNYQRG